MNKANVFLLVVVSSLLTYISTATQPAATAGVAQEKWEYRRATITCREGDICTYRAGPTYRSDGFGFDVQINCVKQTFGEHQGKWRVFAQADSGRVMMSSHYATYNEARKSWSEAIRNELNNAFEDWHVFQVDVESLEQDPGDAGILFVDMYLPYGNSENFIETRHMRRKAS